MANKEKLVKGLNVLFLCIPFAIIGPALFYWKGADSLDNGEPWWFIICLIIMLAAIFFFLKGLRTILNGFFE